jgi:hypothetical protein
MSKGLVPREAFASALQELTAELWHHANSAPNADEIVLPEVTLRGCFRSAADLALAREAGKSSGRAQFDLWWTNASKALPILLWDRWECHELSRAEYEALLVEAEDPGLELSRVVDDKEWLGEQKPLRPLPTWKYHPERMRGVMPFAARVAEIGRQCRGNPSVNELNALVEAWQEPPGYSLAARPLRDRILSTSRNTRAMFRIVDMLMFNAVFCANGRQIFDIPEQLCEMFRKTDVDDIAAEHIKVPYSGVYLHFGPQPDLALDSDWTPEGAYVYELRDDDGVGALQFCVVFAPTDMERYRQFDVNIEPVYVQALGPQHMKMALGEAVDMVLAENMEELSKQIADEPMANPGEEALQLAAENGMQLVSAQVARAREELASLEPRHRTYLEMLKLIVNSLAYLTAYPKDIETTWPERTPASLLKELGKTDNRNEKRRIQSKLAALGFTPVHLCGRRLASELERQSASAGPNRHPAAHWRRGHWRRQPHGPQNSLRKLVWLMPTLVSPGKTAEVVPGHLYLVT